MKNTKSPDTRSRTRRWALVLGVATGLFAVSGAALADRDRPKRGLPGMAFMRVIDDLDLTEEQEIKAIRVRRNLREQAEEARREMDGTMGKVAVELAKANPDATKLHAIADEVIKRIQKVTHSAIDQVLELHRTLSPEQRETLANRLERIEARRDERFGPPEGERGPRDGERGPAKRK